MVTAVSIEGGCGERQLTRLGGENPKRGARCCLQAVPTGRNSLQRDEEGVGEARVIQRIEFTAR